MRHFVNLSKGSMYVMVRLLLVGASLPNFAQGGFVAPNRLPLRGQKLIVTSRAIKRGLERTRGRLKCVMGQFRFSIWTRMHHYMREASSFMESSKVIKRFITQACCPAAGENTTNLGSWTLNESQVDWGSSGLAHAEVGWGYLGGCMYMDR